MFLGLKAPHWALKEGSGIKSSVDSTLLFWFINLAIFARLLTEGDESPLRRCRWNSFLCQNTPADAPCLHQGGGKCTRECVCAPQSWITPRDGVDAGFGWRLRCRGGGASCVICQGIDQWALFSRGLGVVINSVISSGGKTIFWDLQHLNPGSERCY